ncbi:hypothetical protein CAPTEDRAFT_216041 [Capitella teleta]|uniref:MADS-box domain-containing protein n=1 Tax=Capitella teleta TaxID=283909 RepID=R7TYK0_CAPTE|nr:hypothetical protein CAPTEDRAFT_216041 [Capitella teleta]|eukprot:ELT96506.1 hypothetical protein CAPTEDRAFT_216041 [Capitella teleta]
MPRQRRPQDHPNYTRPEGGHRIIEYESNTNRRRNKRNARRARLFKSAHQLSVISGGEVFVRFTDEHQQTYTYATDDTWRSYQENGLRPVDGERRATDSGLVSQALSGPSPTKNSSTELSFTLLGEAQDDLPRIPTNFTVQEVHIPLEEIISEGIPIIQVNVVGDVAVPCTSSIPSISGRDLVSNSPMKITIPTIHMQPVDINNNDD